MPNSPPIMLSQEDSLAIVRRNVPLSRKIEALHELINQHYGFIHRMAVALYDDKTDLLKTFVHSSQPENELDQYESRLSDSRTLSTIRASGQARIVNDLSVFSGRDAVHVQKIRGMGLSSSYTLPILDGDRFFGFVFFNSRLTGVFTGPTLHCLDLIAHLLSLTVIQEICRLETLTGAVNTARNFTHHRDNETGEHLERMARYSRLIAQHVAGEQALDDEFVEHLFLFAPLHDIGKIAIADDILLKPGKLDEHEYAIMKTHPEKGAAIIDSMLSNLGLGRYHYSNLLRNITLHHHEMVDGSGYPHGLRGDQIPLEARIVAVADIFDALTSRRPYKAAWSLDAALAEITAMAERNKLDEACVQALTANPEKVAEIYRQFLENSGASALAGGFPEV